MGQIKHIKITSFFKKCVVRNMNIIGPRYLKKWFGKKINIKLFGMLIDNVLKFYSHILNKCLKANKKLSVLCRLRAVIDGRIKPIRIKFFPNI